MKMRIDVKYKSGLLGFKKEIKFYYPKSGKRAVSIIDDLILSGTLTNALFYINDSEVSFYSFLKEARLLKIKERMKEDIEEKRKGQKTFKRKKYDVKVYDKESKNVLIHFDIVDMKNGVYIERKKMTFTGRQILGNNVNQIDKLYTLNYATSEKYVDMFGELLDDNENCVLVISTTSMED